MPRVIDRNAWNAVRSVLTWVFCSTTLLAAAQPGGDSAFDFLRLPGHARLAALGGVNVSLADRDVNFFHENPALVGDTLSGFVSAGYQFYLADVGNALFSYAHSLPGVGPLLVGVRHTDYGTIPGYDAAGVETAPFSPSETAISAATSHRIGHFRLGASLRTVFSNIGGYRATALMTDIGGVFLHPQQELSVGLVFKNMGVVVSDYGGGNGAKLPLDVQAGVTFRPEHMPLRFSFTGYRLVQSRWSWFDDPSPAVVRTIFSHLNAGAEILLHRNVNLLAGYNYLLHRTLQAEAAGSGAGISYGFSLLVKPVELVFSRNPYTVGNAGYSFTLSMNTNELLRRKQS